MRRLRSVNSLLDRRRNWRPRWRWVVVAGAWLSCAAESHAADTTPQATADRVDSTTPAAPEPTVPEPAVPEPTVPEPASTHGESGATSHSDSAADELTFPIGNTSLELFPGPSFYPRYLADPRQPMMKGLVLGVLKSDTPDHGTPLMEFTMGGRVELFTWYPAGHPELGVQLSIHMAFLGRFDPDNHYDAIGWDGYYGSMLAFRPIASLGLKLAHQHDSAHVADEYIQRTGRRRIHYTREELALGAMFEGLAFLRPYVEAGYAIHLGPADGLKHWRLQSGLELDFGLPYAAIDVNVWQEQRFRPTTTVQLGVKVDQKDSGRRYGVAVQFENGRSVLGEFYQDQNRTLGGGFWFDL